MDFNPNCPTGFSSSFSPEFWLNLLEIFLTGAAGFETPPLPEPSDELVLLGGCGGPGFVVSFELFSFAGNLGAGLANGFGGASSVVGGVDGCSAASLFGSLGGGLWNVFGVDDSSVTGGVAGCGLPACCCGPGDFSASLLASFAGSLGAGLWNGFGVVVSSDLCSLGGVASGRCGGR